MDWQSLIYALSTIGEKDVARLRSSSSKGALSQPERMEILLGLVEEIAIGRLVRAKMTSGNKTPVERCVVTEKDISEIRTSLSEARVYLASSLAIGAGSRAISHARRPED